MERLVFESYDLLELVAWIHTLEFLYRVSTTVERRLLAQPLKFALGVLQILAGRCIPTSYATTSMLFSNSSAALTGRRCGLV